MNTQKDHFLEISIPDYQSRIEVLRLEGIERLSSLFQYTLHLVPDNPDEFNQLKLGQTSSFAILHHSNEKQWFNGIIESIQYSGLQNAMSTPAIVTIVPQLSVMRQDIVSYAFVNQTVVEILQTLCRKHTILSVDYSELVKEYPVLPYCVQYQESDYDFLVRLCKEYGVYYYFKQSKTDHTLVFSDYAIPRLSYDRVLTHGHPTDRPSIFNWKRKLATEVPTKKSRSFTKATPREPSQAEVQSRKMQSKLPIQHPSHITHDEGGYHPHQNHADITSRLRLQQMTECVQANMIQCSSTSTGLVAGMQIKVMSDSDSTINGQYYVVGIQHYANSGDRNTVCAYQNELNLLPQDIPFILSDHDNVPAIPGVIPALVAGPRDAEVYATLHAEIKIRPKWQSEQDYDKTPSSWVRCMQAWAGEGFGCQFIPRVGQEVLLNFQQGHPHKPSVIRSVYNPAQLPVHHPESQSGFKTQSLGGVANDGHALRFDDIPGKETLYLKSQKDKEVLVKGERKRHVKQRLKTEIRAGKSDIRVSERHVTEAGKSLSLQVGTSEIRLDTTGAHFHADAIHLDHGEGNDIIPQSKENNTQNKGSILSNHVISTAEKFVYPKVGIEFDKEIQEEEKEIGSSMITLILSVAGQFYCENERSMNPLTLNRNKLNWEARSELGKFFKGIEIESINPSKHEITLGGKSLNKRFAMYLTPIRVTPMFSEYKAEIELNIIRKKQGSWILSGLTRLTLDMRAIKKPKTSLFVDLKKVVDRYLNHVRLDLLYASLAVILMAKLQSGIIGGDLSLLDKPSSLMTDVMDVVIAVAK